ncbi:PLP-dependent aminotransferase family protein [Jannaschia sp. M317]|uniref:MocR-like pyridoxine biosynthesis transcription factor PdxR n=1 Tax=Jannaschia sp. M317 TaxID=2867011 RepID=UPI0021A639AB|nr:PLP-dependent aminotransferase family protein [Jannaschia sp. M317]UWQ19887.1 PLP-dependent aminotransferase family protein [Jannaschia sp. M317]
MTLQRDSETSLQSQIFDRVREMILNGSLRGGMALTPSRTLSKQLNVSRNTVTLAYDRLVAEGYVTSKGTAGLVVTSIPPDHFLAVANAAEASPVFPLDHNNPIADGTPMLCYAGIPGGETNGPAYDFWVGRSAADAFPLDTWRRLAMRRLAQSPRHLTDYCDPAGLHDLRNAIARHLARNRGMTVSADQIIVTSGSQDGISLVLNLLRPQVRRLCIETPGYNGAKMLFDRESLPLEAVAVDANGLTVADLPRGKGNLAFVTPSHQFPTGVMLSLSRRLELLKWATATESFVLEDDYDSDFRYEGAPLTPLAMLDRSRRVFYLGTFSKSIGAGVRIGFVVVPRAMVDDAREMKAAMSNGQSWLEQAILADFIDQGHFERHLRKLHKIYKARRNRLITALNDAFGPRPITGQDGGLHLVWRLPSGAPDARHIQIQARDLGVGVYAPSSGAAFDIDENAPDDRLIFGYSSLTEENIDKAVKLLRTLIGAQSGTVGEGARP